MGGWVVGNAVYVWLIEASKRQFIFCVVVYFGWCVSPVAVYYVID